MTEKTKEPNERDANRQAALANLGASSKLPQLAFAYTTHADTSALGKVGEHVGYALFQDALKDPNIVVNDLLNQDEKNGLLYSGTISSAGIISRANQVVTASLISLRASDFATLTGTQLNVGAYADRYVADLLAEGSSDRDKKVAQGLIDVYMQALSEKYMSKGLKDALTRAKSGLENIVNS